MSFGEQQLHSEFILENQLKAYAAQDLYPMHMPGHKRQLVGDQSVKIPAAAGVRSAHAGCKAGTTTELPYGWDVTEVPGTDDLHDAQGILREAMDRTAALYGVARTWYLVNGSTCGLLAGIRAIAPYGSEVIVARNCHKAVYHAIELQNLTVHWLWPTRDPEYDVYESVDPAAVRELLAQYPETAAVVLTSPTYEGIVSDIQAIAQICHEHDLWGHPEGIPLLIDEAHGAHLGFHAAFPDSAVQLGADLVIQSPHKTLPSLTQTAWMHLPQDSIVEPESIERELDIFETSSPSYPLMASLDACTGILAAHGEEMFAAYVDRLDQIIRPMAETLQHLWIPGYNGEWDRADWKRAYWDRGHIYATDPSKILISGRECRVDGRSCTGARLADILREDYQVETEMHLGMNVLAMTSVCDTEEGLQRLADALKDLDQRVRGAEPVQRLPGEDAPTDAVMTIAEAVRQPQEAVNTDDAIGRIAAEYVYCYPPGIPIVVPGERITRDVIMQLMNWQYEGATVHHSGMKDGCLVVRE